MDLVMAVCIRNLSIQEAEAGGLLPWHKATLGL